MLLRAEVLGQLCPQRGIPRRRVLFLDWLAHFWFSLISSFTRAASIIAVGFRSGFFLHSLVRISGATRHSASSSCSSSTPVIRTLATCVIRISPSANLSLHPLDP